MIIEMLIAMLIVLIMCGISAVIGFFVGYKVNCLHKARDEPKPLELTEEQKATIEKEKRDLENFYKYNGKMQ